MFILLTLLALPSGAQTISGYDRITRLVREASAATTSVEIDRLLRAAAAETGADDTSDISRAHAVVYYDDWMPRARVWLRGVAAEHLFRDILLDNYLPEAIAVDGEVDIELEIRAGSPAIIRGRMHVENASFRWKEGDFALNGVTGFIPFFRTIGPGVVGGSGDNRIANISIDTMQWARRIVATALTSTASYENRVLRFGEITMNVMGGRGVGGVVMDHRGSHWRSAAMIRVNYVDLRKLNELLPSLPVIARVTRATMRGEIGLVYEAPNRLSITGKLESLAPGVIEIAPRLRESLREYVDTRVLAFSRLEVEIGRNEEQQAEAVITLYRQTSANLADLWRGRPFIPHRLVVRVPLLSLVEQLSQR